VQAELEKAMSTVFEEKISLTGCGRTDTGVHARDFYAHFDSEDLKSAHPDRTFKLNSFLPSDIGIKRIIKMNPEAHARFDAISRTYKYYISTSRDPFNADRSYYLYGNVDVDLMNKGAAILFDYNDFGCFSKTHTQVKTNICKIQEAYWSKQDNLLIFTIKADRFLRNMVRAIVGTLLDVGRKKITLEEFRTIIENKDRKAAGFSVPAQGLFLEKVEYPEGMING
jgi:tRNA pseudouridine38-40 synthase